MVFCGRPSRGCERCRKRKVKCDQQKPSCTKCARANLECPGYRDLGNVIFRDASANATSRVANSSRLWSPCTERRQEPAVEPDMRCVNRGKIQAFPSPPCHNLGASFFFTKYSFNEEPVFSGYHDWLSTLYMDEQNHPALTAAIEAVGLAGLSNCSYGRELRQRSRARYCSALTILKQALNDPIQATADETLVAVILLILFEVVNFKDWESYNSWATHVNATAALLELRGQSQFSRHRGGQLFIQSRSQILLACMQQCTAVPPGVVQSTFNFSTSAMRRQWQHSKFASPGSMSEICLRTIDLRAAVKNDEISDLHSIMAAASDLDRDLDTWRRGLPSEWLFTTTGQGLGSQTHTYLNNFVADAWNNWRGLNILVRQIVLEHPNSGTTLLPDEYAMHVSKIQALSTDICNSMSYFDGRARIITLTQPLYLVAWIDFNTIDVRQYAVKQLRHIASTTGIQQAYLLAETAEQTFGNPARAACVPWG